MPIRVIVDTSLLVALIDDKDTWRDAAGVLSDSLVRQEAELVYFDCVVNETISVLCRRLRERKTKRNIATALGLLEQAVIKENITWIYPAVKKYYAELLGLVTESAGRLNFHDALICVAAKDLGLERIASFDGDFDEVPWLDRLGE